MAYDEEYYQKLKREDYQALQQSELQLDAARQRAMKNTQTQLNSLGMGSSGYGSTARAGIEGQYMQGLQTAQDRYNANVQQHNEEYANFKTQETQNYLSMLEKYQGDSPNMYMDLQEKGYGTYNKETGEFTWDDNKLNEMNPADASMLKEGVSGLDYSNNAYNQSLTGNFVTQGITNLENTAEDEDSFKSNLLQLLISAGVIKEREVEKNGKKEKERYLDLNILDPSSRQTVQYYSDRYGLLDMSGVQTPNNTTSTNYYDPNSYFAKAHQMQDKNSQEYKKTMALGYDEILDKHFSVKDWGRLKKNDGLTLKIGSESVRLRTDGKVDTKTQGILSTIESEPKDSDIIFYDGKIYLYSSRVDSWLKVKDSKKGKVDDAVNAIKNYAQGSLGYDPYNPVKS